jgi:hypothetical protein
MTDEQERKARQALAFARYNQYDDEHAFRHIRDIAKLTDEEATAFLYRQNYQKEELPF